MNQADYDKAESIQGLIDDYSLIQKTLMGVGIKSILVLKDSNIESSTEELVLLKDKVLEIVTNRLNELKQEFDSI